MTVVLKFSGYYGFAETRNDEEVRQSLSVYFIALKYASQSQLIPLCYEGLPVLVQSNIIISVCNSPRLFITKKTYLAMYDCL